jgi:hypothetical protein
LTHTHTHTFTRTDLLANLQLTRTSSIEGLLEAPANFAADDIDFDDDDF